VHKSLNLAGGNAGYMFRCTTAIVGYSRPKRCVPDTAARKYANADTDVYPPFFAECGQERHGYRARRYGSVLGKVTEICMMQCQQALGGCDRSVQHTSAIAHLSLCIATVPSLRIALKPSRS
jgi:hypothetical protein